MTHLLPPILAEAIDAKLNVSVLDAIPWRVCALRLARVHKQVGQIPTDISVSVYVPVLEFNPASRKECEVSEHLTPFPHQRMSPERIEKAEQFGIELNRLVNETEVIASDKNRAAGAAFLIAQDQIGRAHV